MVSSKEFRHKEDMKVLFFHFISEKLSDDYPKLKEAIVSILKEKENDYFKFLLLFAISF